MTPRGHNRFRRTELQRLMTAVQRAGLSVAKVECDASGKISVIPGRPGETAPDNAWDEVLTDAEKRSA